MAWSKGWAAPSRSEPAFELLEDRCLFAAQPVVTIDGAGDTLIGETTQITVSFQNVPDASPGSNVGFAPYIDLILPTRGADGSASDANPAQVKDGVTFQGATLGQLNLDITQIEFDSTGTAVHPFARDASGNLRVVHASDYGAQPGDTLVAIRLPFGSYVDTQPAAPVQVTLGVSNLADLNVPLSVSAVGGFAFGRDALNNPTADAPVVGSTANGSITPVLFTVNKTSNLPESETATGPSYPHQYTVTLDIADGQTINNLILTDMLPNGVVVTNVTVPGATVQQVDGDVIATFGSPVTGTLSPADVTMTIDFFVGEFMGPDQPSVPVLDPTTGGSRVLENNIKGSADWTPVDTRDDPQNFVLDPAGPENVIVAKALATQKTATIVGGNQTAIPGDVIEWTIRTQISDYFSLDQLNLSDLLSDGQTFDASFTPTIFVREQGADLFTGGFNAANYSVGPEGTGTRVIFRVGDEMVSRGFNSVLDGGDGGSDGLTPLPTELVIVFRSRVDATFNNGDPVLHDDSITNSVQSQATIDNGTGNQVADNSNVVVPITPGQIDGKTVYAINGNTSVGATPVITNGDVVTFRIQYTIPPQSGQDFVLTDFLPLPIFAAGSISFIDQISGVAPGANQAWFGPSDTFDSANPTGYSGLPQIIVGAASNSISFVYGDYDLGPGSGPVHIDILFSVVVQDQPFGDGLVMNNVVQATETNSSGRVTTGLDTAEVILSQPELVLQKGIVASTNPDTVFNPSPAAPVSFSDPGSGGVRFSGTISSNLLAGSDIISDVTRVDAGDIVTFAIIVENNGSGRNGAFDILIRDTLAAGFAIPGGAAGLNLRVTDGAGNDLAFTGDLFTTGITLTDQPGAGSLAPEDATSGRNILVITYDLQLIDTVATPNLTIANNASIDHYAAQEGGTDFAPNLLPEDRSDSASATTAGPGILKAVVDTSLPQSSGSTLLIGEEVWYDVTVTLAEGSLNGFILTDTLPNTAGGKLSLIDATLLSIGGNISFAGGAPQITQIDSNGDGIVDRVTVNFGDTLNTPDNIVDANDRIVLRVHAVLPNLPENNSGDRLTNTAVASFTDGNGDPQTITATAPITVGAPGPTITKTATGSTTVDAGDIVEYEVVVNNPVIGGVAVSVFDLLVGDRLVDAHLTLIVGSVLVTSGSGAVVLEGNGAGDTAVLISLAELGAGQALTFRYRALVGADVVAGQTLINTAVQRSDSAPGDVADQRVFISSDNETLLVATPTLVKQVTGTSLADTGTAQGNPALEDVAFGETVTFTLTATMPEGITQLVILLDQLPIGPGLMEATAASIAAIGANLVIGSGAVVGTAGVLSDRNGDGRPDTITFDLGDVTNTADGAVDANDQIQFQITARLISTSGAAPGAVTTNTGQLSFDTPSGTSNANASASVEIVAPTFNITKTPDVQHVDGGDLITYTVRITNTGGAFSAPGYDLLINDLLDDPSLSLIVGSVSVAVTSPPGVTITSGNGPGDTAVGIAAARLAQGEVIIVTYRAIVDNLVPSATQLLNRVTYAADSYPGDVPGERDFSGAADAVVQVEGPISIKAIASTSLTETGSSAFIPSNPDLAIGERVTYRIAQIIPEGSTTLRIVDSLPTAGTALEFLAFRLVTKGGNITLPQAPIVTQLDTDGDGRIDQVTIDFGTVTNLVDNQISVDDLLAIDIDARVIDDPRNVAGDVATNRAEIFVNNALFATRTASADIVEPDIVIHKSASVSTGDAGDEITFTVTGSPSASMSGPAYDLVFLDTLAPGLQLIAGSVTASGGTIVEGNGAGDTRIRITGVALLPTDGVITVTYRARLLDSVENGQVIQNTGTLNYASAPDVEDREYTTSASSTVNVVLNPDIHKSVALTDIPETGTRYFDPTIVDVNQGETIVYRITIRLGEGTQSVTLTDVMPAGLTFLQLGAIRFGANISGLVVDNGAPFTIVGNDLTFFFGTLINHGDNLSNGADEITVDVIARAGAGNTAGTQLTNTSTITSTSPGLPSVPAVERSSSATVEVVAPDPVITKTASIVSGDAGDEVLYTVVVSQSAVATGPLFHATISDLLGPGLVLIPGSVTTTRGTVDFGNGPGNDLVIVSPGRVFNVGDAPITITYRARLADSVEPGQILINTANVSGETTFIPNPDSVVYDVADTAQVTVDMPVTLTKTVIASSIDQTQTSQINPANPDAAIGEIMTYRVAAALSEGTQRVVITDTLPVGVTIVAVRSSLPGFSPVITISGNTITADFGIVVNTGNNVAEAINLGIDIDVRVDDVATNVAGTVLTNTSDITISSPTAPGVPGGTETASASADIDIVEPDLVLTKVTNAGFVAPGEAVPWTLTLQHAAGSTSAAFDILIEDLLAGTGLDLIAGTVVVNRGIVVSGNSPGDNTITIALGSLEIGETLTISFQTRLSATTPPAATVINTANGDFDSAPGIGGRPDDVTAQATLPVAPGITKAIIDTDIPQTGSAAFDPALTDLAIGETVTYRIVATLPQTTVNGFAINDLLPAGLEALSATVVSIGSALSGSLLQPGDAGTISGQGISFVFGTIVNGGSAAIGAEDTIVIEVVARVRDVAGNTAGTALVNATDAVFTIGGRSGEQSASATAEVVEPQLVVTKQADHPTGDAGDVFTYTVTIAHSAASSGPAFDLVLEDILPSVLQGLSVSASVGTATLTGNTVRLTLPQFLPGDAPIVLTYTVRMTDAIEPGQQVPNIATLSFDSAPAGVGRDGAGQASTTITGVLGVDLSKEIVATSLPQTGTGQFDPNRPDLAIGETVTYRLTATLSEGTQRLIILDEMPAGLVPISVNLIDIGALIGSTQPVITINGQAVSLDFGVVVNPGNNVAGDGVVVIEIVARVADTAANQAGRVLENAAAAVIASPSNPTAPGGVVQDTAGAAAEVVTPAIVVDKTADVQFAMVGQQVTYTVVVGHAPGSTAPVFDLVIEDLLVPGMMVLSAGSVTSSLGTIVSGNNAGDGTIRIVVPEFLLGQTITIRYTVEITNIPVPNPDIVNTVAANGVTAPGEIPPGFVRPVIGGDTASVTAASGGDYPAGAALDRGLLDDYQLTPVRPLPVNPIFTGRGNPGSAIQLTGLDRSGGLMGVTTTLVDYGGNWIAALPAANAPLAVEGAVDTLARSNLFRDRVDGFQISTSYGDANPPGSAISPQPFTLSVSYSDPTPFVASHVVETPQLRFDGAYIVRTQFKPAAEVASLDLMPPEIESLVWNSFARDFAAALLERR